MTQAEPINKKGYLHEDFRLFHLCDSEGQEADFHFHEFNKLVIPIRGNVTYTLEGVSYALQSRDVLLVKHHAIHRTQIDRSQPYERYILYLNPRYIGSQFAGSRLQTCFDGESRLLHLQSADSEKAEQLLCELEAELASQREDSILLRNALLTQLLVMLGRANAAGTGERVMFDEKLSPVLSYINEHLREPLTVELLAEKAYLSRYHFMRVFKERTGQTIHSYVRQKRLETAARLIREGTPVLKAAEESGFSDYTAFLRAFQKTYGLNPAALKP